MVKEWSPKETVAQMLNALSSSWSRLLLDSVKEREDRSVLLENFILPGKVIRAEWDKSSSMVENIKSKPQRSK